jgi:uncharacterized protein YecA (UPF0149 family)
MSKEQMMELLMEKDVNYIVTESHRVEIKPANGKPCPCGSKKIYKRCKC